MYIPFKTGHKTSQAILTGAGRSLSVAPSVLSDLRRLFALEDKIKKSPLLRMEGELFR